LRAAEYANDPALRTLRSFFPKRFSKRCSADKKELTSPDMDNAAFVMMKEIQGLDATSVPENVDSRYKISFCTRFIPPP